MIKTTIIRRRIRDIKNIVKGMETASRWLDPHAKHELSKVYDSVNIDLAELSKRVGELELTHKSIDNIPEVDYNSLVASLDDMETRCYDTKFPYDSVNVLTPFEVRTLKESKSTLAYIFDSIPSLAWLLLAYGVMNRLSNNR